MCVTVDFTTGDELRMVQSVQPALSLSVIGSPTESSSGAGSAQDSAACSACGRGAGHVAPSEGLRVAIPRAPRVGPLPARDIRSSEGVAAAPYPRPLGWGKASESIPRSDWNDRTRIPDIRAASKKVIRIRILVF